MKKVTIDSSVFSDGDQGMLEDLIIAAHNDAKAKADAESKSNMSVHSNMGSLPE